MKTLRRNLKQNWRKPELKSWRNATHSVCRWNSSRRNVPISWLESRSWLKRLKSWRISDNPPRVSSDLSFPRRRATFNVSYWRWRSEWLLWKTVIRNWRERHCSAIRRLRRTVLYRNRSWSSSNEPLRRLPGRSENGLKSLKLKSRPSWLNRESSSRSPTNRSIHWLKQTLISRIVWLSWRVRSVRRINVSKSIQRGLRAARRPSRSRHSSYRRASKSCSESFGNLSATRKCTGNNVVSMQTSIRNNSRRD